MTIHLNQGQLKVLFEFQKSPLQLQIKEPERKITPQLFRQKIEEQLLRLKPDLSNVAIVVGDKTRLCGYPEYLPVLLSALKKMGADNQVTIFIAYGTHPNQSEEESLKAYGETFHRETFIHHDCTDRLQFRLLGKTSRGTPVYLRNDIAETSFLITFGAISHHYFAGYGGGRKLIFPGLGFKPAIYQNHSLFLDPKEGRLSQGCQPGKIQENPLAEDLAEIESYKQADLCIHGILDSHGEVCDLLVGSGQSSFEEACKTHGENCGIEHNKQYDLVVASCGGFPKDVNFIQSHKAIHNAAKFVKDGGELIVLAECRDGIGSKTFLPWFEFDDYEAAFDRLSRQYEGNGGTALAMMEKTRRIRISLITELADTEAELIGINKIQLSQAQEKVKGHVGTVAVIPNASLLVKTA